MTVRFDPNAPPSTPRDAATVVLLRDGADGLEVFFVKRHADVRFMGGAYVFPGGKLDPGDVDPAVPCDVTGADAARRLGEDDPARARGLHVAALRECLEEAGVLFAREPVAADAVAALRHAVDHEKQQLTTALAARDVTLRASALVPLARWITPRAETRRFDARFFLAAAPAGAAATHDNGETVASQWLTPREALARAQRAEIVLAPPTYLTAAVLARCADTATALALAPDVIPTIEPEVVFENGTIIVALPGDPLHPSPGVRMMRHSQVPEENLLTRFFYENGAWRGITAVR